MKGSVFLFRIRDWKVGFFYIALQSLNSGAEYFGSKVE